MLRSRVFVLVGIIVFGLSTASLLAQDNGSGLVFTGCPPYIEGNHCDSMFYQVVAVDIGTGQASPEAKYFIVSGPGEINSKTGLWQFHPEREDIPPHYQEVVEIAAYKGNDTTTSDENCSFSVRVYDKRASFEGYCGAHMTVFPGDMMVVPLEVTDQDYCHDPEITRVEIQPTPSGLFVYDSVAMTVTFVPDMDDQDQSFEVVVAGLSGPSSFYCRFWFDCFEPELIKLRVELAPLQDVQPGDTVNADLIVDECPLYLEYIDLTMWFDSRWLSYLDAIPGAPFFDPDTGCGWSSLYSSTGYSCAGTGRTMINLRAFAGGGVLPSTTNCYKPREVPAVLATLQFVVNDLLEPGLQFVPIDFYWCDCKDNQLWSPAHGELYSASEVMTPNGRRIRPTRLPGPSGASDECFFYEMGTVERYRNVWFRNGGIRLNLREQDPQYSVRLGILEDQLLGQFLNLPITLESMDSTQGLGGFDFLIGYSGMSLAFQQAFEGDLYDSCGWEYFTYRYGGPPECGTACPSGMLRVVGLADMNDGPNYPGCDDPFPGYVQPGQLPTTLAVLRFLVSNDRNLACTFVPIGFFWYDCGDNLLSNHDGREVYLSARVFGEFDTLINQETELPSWYGAPSECVNYDPATDRLTRRYVDYHNGGIGIIGDCPIDMRGDINLNVIPWEIADAVMYQNYFISGLVAFGSHVEGSIAASDCNADGIALSVADFVFMMRMIIGDAMPCIDVTPSANAARFSLEPAGVVSLVTPDSLGAVHLIVEGEVTPTLMADHMEMMFGWDTGWTKILVYSYEANQFLSSGALVNVSGATGIIEVSTATFSGCPVESVIESITDVNDDPGNLPTVYALHQNYPNPFNPTTVIEYDLPKSSAVRLEIYNITGQKVRTLVSGQLAAGWQSAEWDGRDASGRRVSSGIYLYRLTAGEFVQTRKMLLLK